MTIRLFLDALSGTLILRRRHFTLGTCGQPMHGLEYIKADRYDTVITDVHLQSMTACNSSVK